MPGFTEQEAREAVAASKSYAETLRRLGLRAAGGNFRLIRRWLERWDVCTEHFDPYAASRGPRRYVLPLDAVLVEHSTYQPRQLKLRLYEQASKPARASCAGRVSSGTAGQ
jgi:hypothetical protein